MLAFAVLASAHSYTAGSIQIGHPYAHPTVAGQTAGGGFLKLVNQGGPDRLLSARSNRAAAVEMHSMRMDGSVMRMRQVEAIDLPAGQTVELRSGGWHLMFVGLKTPLTVGERFPVVLQFEKAGEVTVEVVVQKPGSVEASAASHPHDDSHHHGTRRQQQPAAGEQPHKH